MRKKERLALWFSIALVVLVDRGLWATVSQWREDQATALWLGFTRPLTQMPVGLISSVGLPNPNGMVVLGSMLSQLPSLWGVSIVLSCLQAVLILATCWVSFEKNTRMFMLACIPLLTSILLRGSSVEFWGQSLMTTANLAFLLWAVLYLRKPTLGKIPILIGLVAFAPALYLAGLVNSVVMVVIGMGLITIHPPRDWKKRWWIAVILSLGIAVVLGWLIWLPYFKSVTVGQILATASQIPVGVKIMEAVAAIALAPVWTTALSSDQASLSIVQSSRLIIPNAVARLVDITLFLQLAQAVLALATLLFVLRRYVAKMSSTCRREALPGTQLGAARLVILSIAFLLASYTLSPLLGGPSWATGERRDQLVQFFPFFALFWFLTPFAFNIPEAISRMTRMATVLLMISYSATSMVAGLMVVQSHLSYQGASLTDADVPLLQKMQVVDFIASDWKSFSTTNVVPVDYQLGGNRWDWITVFGHQLDRWYDSPYTIGRGFDYDLLRRYGLRNAQEGVQERVFGTGRYLVTYAFEPPPHPMGYSVDHYLFGRLRVTIMEALAVPGPVRRPEWDDQHSCADCQPRLTAFECQVRMSQVENCFDCVVMERLSSILKCDYADNVLHRAQIATFLASSPTDSCAKYR